MPLLGATVVGSALVDPGAAPGVFPLVVAPGGSFVAAGTLWWVTPCGIRNATLVQLYGHSFATLQPLFCHCNATALQLYCQSMATLLCHFSSTLPPFHCYPPATLLPLFCHFTATLLPPYCHSPATLLALFCHSTATEQQPGTTAAQIFPNPPSPRGAPMQRPKTPSSPLTLS